MVRLNETQPIREVLVRANRTILSDHIGKGFAGVIVETASGGGMLIPEQNNFEGTVIYFPGIPASELMEGHL